MWKILTILVISVYFSGCSSWYNRGHIDKNNSGTFIVNDSIRITNAEILAGTNEAKDSVAYWIRYDLIINNEIRNQYYYPVPINFNSINYWKIVVDKLESEYKSGVKKPIIKQYPIKTEEEDADTFKSV